MTRDAVLSAFLEGARISTLARIVGEAPEGVEDALRFELQTIREEYEPRLQVQPPTKADVPEQGPAQKARPGRSSTRPRPSKVKNAAGQLAESPARKAVARLVNGTVRLSKTDLITDWLRQEPLTCAEIADKARAAMIETSDHEKWATDGIFAMRVKGLVIRPEQMGGKWRLAD